MGGASGRQPELKTESRGRFVLFSSAESAFEPRLFYKIAQTARRAFADVVVIAQAEKDDVVNGVGIIALHRPRNRLSRIVGLSWRAVRRARRERATLYQMTDPELLPWAPVLQSLTRRPVVFDLREYHAERIREKQWLPWVLREPAARLYATTERLVVRRLAGCLAVNDDLATRLRSSGCRHVAVVPNYPPLELFAEIRRDSEIEARRGDERWIVYSGALAQSRGISIAVEALALLIHEFPGTRLLLIGGFDSAAYRAEIDELVRVRGVGEHVTCIGPIPHDKVPAYLAASDVGLCLLQPEHRRYHETEPVKYFECAAAGIAQVVSDLPALRRLVEKNENALLVDPTSATAVADAIACLLREPETRRALGERGRKAFLAEYNWSVAAERLISLYEEVLGESCKRRRG